MRQVLGFWIRHRPQAAWMVTVLAVAVAVATATWSIAYGLWIERLPFADPDRLVSVGWTAPNRDDRMGNTSADEYVDLQAATKSIMDIAGVEVTRAWYLKSGDSLTPVATVYATTNLFDVLGVRPALGRSFEPADADATASVPRATFTPSTSNRFVVA